MSGKRIPILFSILKGVFVAMILTLLGMLIMAALTVFARISDNALTALNQALKIIAILLGTRTAVGRGGSRGFVTGCVVAILYMIVGYGLYVCLGGGAFNAAQMLGEILLGAAIGSLAGAVLANMRPKARRRARAAQS